jgi:hypothetical protein
MSGQGAVITRELTVFSLLLNYSGARTRKAGRPCIDVQVDARLVFKSFPSPEKIFRKLGLRSCLKNQIHIVVP